jgi:hypothetical protein
VRLIIPVGLEKRVYGNLDDLACEINRPGAHGPRLLPVPGEVVTELEAIGLLTGAKAKIIAAGGVSGAEGSVWLSVCGKPDQEERAAVLLQSLVSEPAFKI